MIFQKNSIPYNNLSPVQNLIDVNRVVARVMKKGDYILGREVSLFEEEFAHSCFLKHCVGVASGFDAIRLCLMALEIGQNDTVLTVANSAPPTVAAIRSLGAKVEYIDCDNRGLADLKQLYEMDLSKYKVFVPVHLYGRVVDIGPYLGLLKRNKVLVVEDACQAHGSLSNYVIGRNTVAACYSFYPTKNLGALGDGGAVVTNEPWIAEEVKALRNYGSVDSSRYFRYGINSRLDEIQAAFLREKLKSIVEINAYKRALSEKYYNNLKKLKDILRCSPVTDGENSHIFPIFTESRDKLLEFLFKYGVGTKVHYPIPSHKQPCEIGEFVLPITEYLCKTELSLPNWYGMTFGEVDRVCSLIWKFYDKKQ